ncbi:MAG: type IV pilus assembly protein FimV, partial [Endozoicomonas sp.]
KLVVVMAALGGSIVPLSASALGLGEAKLYSTLNQPLMAEIELTQVRELTRNEILSNLASKIDFQRAGIERPFMLNGLKFRTEVGPNGNGIIKVTSSQPIHEPYLNFLVEVHWPNGRLLKEYTLLLNPPAFSGRLMSPVDQATSDSSTYRATPILDEPVPRRSSSIRDSLPSRSVAQNKTSQPTDNGSLERRNSRPDTRFSTRSAPRYSSGDNDTYHVQRNDSLWEIARDVRPGNDLSIQQTMMAIQRVNPEAFIDNNINRLKSGQVLRIPDRNEIASITKGEAINDVSRQNREWSGRSRVAQLDATRISSADSGKSQNSNRRGSLAIVTPDSSTGRGQDLGGGSVENQAGLQTELAMTREQLDKVSRENSEMKSRLNNLDEQIETLERLMVMKEDQLAALQNQIWHQSEQADISEPSVRQELDTPLEAEIEPVPTPETEPFQMEKVGVISFLLGNPMLLAVLGVLPFGAVLILFLKRRRKMQEDIDDDDDFQALDISPVRSSGIKPVSEDDQIKFDEALSIDNSVDNGASSQQIQDVISEADTYIAYGHLDQAEELVQQAINHEPGRVDLKAKLAEIYAEKGNPLKFEQAMAAVQATGDATAIQAAESFRFHFPNNDSDNVT